MQGTSSNRFWYSSFWRFISFCFSPDGLAHLVYGGGHLAHFVGPVQFHRRGVVAGGDGARAFDQMGNGSVDELQDENEDDARRYQEYEDGQGDDALLRFDDFLVRVFQGDDYVERAQDFLVLRMHVAAAGGAAPVRCRWG